MPNFHQCWQACWHARQIVDKCPGCTRTLEAYWEYAMIDIHERTARSHERFCEKHTRRRAPEAAVEAGVAADAAAAGGARMPSRFLLGDGRAAQPAHWAAVLAQRLRVFMSVRFGLHAVL